MNLALTNGSYEFYDDINNVDRMVIDSSGNVGIGTSSPYASSTLSVAGPVAGRSTGVDGTFANVFNATYSGNTTQFGSIQHSMSSIATSSGFRFLGGGAGGGGTTQEKLLDLTRGQTIFYTGSTERMRIDSSGNVGIGTSSITSGFKMEVVGGARFGDVAGDDAVELGWSVGGSQGFIQAYDRGASAFRQLSINNAITISSSGNVGIGTSSPIAKLQIKTQTNGNASFQNSTSVTGGVKINAFNDAGNASVPFEIDGSSLQFNIASVEKMRIDSSGNVGIGTSSPATGLHVSGPDNLSSSLTLQNTAPSPDNIWRITPLYNSGDLAVFDDGTERMRIDSSGNVGIGTNSPDYNLVINDSSGPSIRLDTNSAAENASLIMTESSGTSGSNGGFIRYNGSDNRLELGVGTSWDTTRMVISRDTGNVGIGTSSPYKSLTVGSTDASAWITSGGSNVHLTVSPNGASGSFIVRTGGTNGDPSTTTERMRIDSSGNLLVGKTATSGATDGAELRSTGLLVAVTTDDHAGYFNRKGSDGLLVVFSRQAALVGSISVTASATSYNTSSDYRLKTDAQPMTGASARVQALNPVNFEWLSDGTRVDGFLAHEAQEVVPEAVTGTKDAMRDEEYEVTPAVLDDDGNVVTEAVMGTRSVPDYQGIDQSKLVPLLTAALQEALTKIDALETRITALEG